MLAAATTRLVDLGAIETLCAAIERGSLTKESTSVARAHLADGREAVARAAGALQELWSAEYPRIGATMMSGMLRAGAAAIYSEQARAARIEVVWTGPMPVGSYVRTTPQVVREIVSKARTELTIVGYWLVAGEQETNFVQELLGVVASRVTAGVRVTVILDERRRRDGVDNRDELNTAWPAGSPLPTLLTWRLPPGDLHLKLHAKVIVADREDALVTSANLTTQAMERNIEMGVRIEGAPAATIARHFQALIEGGVLERY